MIYILHRLDCEYLRGGEGRLKLGRAGRRVDSDVIEQVLWLRWLGPRTHRFHPALYHHLHIHIHLDMSPATSKRIYLTRHAEAEHK